MKASGKIAIILLVAAAALLSFSAYVFFCRDNRTVRYVIHDPQTGSDRPAPENVRTQKMLHAGKISLVSGLALGGFDLLLIGFILARKRTR